jgi:DHA1 family chloramphenicol resistance protein-like MFS transporter
VAVIALFAAGTFCAFSYLAPLLTKVAKLDDSWVPLTLALYGFGALIGSGVGGRFADARLLATIYGGTAATGTVLAAVAITAENAVAVAVLSFVLGLASFITAPALNAHMFHIAHPAPTLAGATATAAFNVGNTAGPWIGGVVISAGFGYRNVAWAGAALLVCAVAVTGLARALGKHGAVGDPRAEEASVEPTVSK